MKSAGFLKKMENSIAKILLTGPRGSIVVFNVVLPDMKLGLPLLHGPETECIQTITLRKFGSDLLIRFPAKNEISDDRSLLQQGDVVKIINVPKCEPKNFQRAEEIGSGNAIRSSTSQASFERRFGRANKLSVEING
jgi:hypothetical protein